MAITDNLISHYKLDDAGGTAVDETSYGDGTITNSNVSQAGKIGDSISCDSSGNDKIDLASGGYQGANYSVNMWFKGTVAQGFIFSNIIRATPVNNYFGWALDLDGSGKVRIAHGDGDGTISNGTIHGTAVNNNAWHMLTATWDGTNARLYVDGTLSQTDGLNAPSYSAVKKPALFGWYYNNGAAFDYKQPYNADEVTIWSRKILGSEITTIWNGGSGLAYPFTVAAAGNSQMMGANF